MTKQNRSVNSPNQVKKPIEEVAGHDEFGRVVPISAPRDAPLEYIVPVVSEVKLRTAAVIAVEKGKAWALPWVPV